MLPAMDRPRLRRLTRNSDATLLFESFFIAAVASFLGVRAFLALAGYPKVGSGGIHIAHMLWGGLLMLAALILVFAFLNTPIHRLAAVVAGLGFGTFIDEIGKFVTADNDYFFRPAVALIYGLFVIAYLVARTVIGQRPLSQPESLANAIVFLAGTVDGPIEPDDRARIERLLARADPKAPLTGIARRYLAELPEAPEYESPAARIHRWLAGSYEVLMANPWAERALTVGVIAYTLFALVGVAAIVISTPAGSAIETWTVASIAQMGSTIAGAVLVGRGVISLPTSRPEAYHWFIRGLLVWILVTQVFVFYSSQFAGLGGLAADLVAYGSLRFALANELSVGGTPRRAASPAG
jgi:hypothetical protein